MYFSDLHVHTSLSDCSEDVSQIIQRAKAVGLTHISFTDHDTTKLSDEHVRMAQNAGIRAIAGIEMSACDGESGVKAHILGFGYTGTSHIEAIGAETLRKRNENCLKQMEILRQLGYRIEEEKIRASPLAAFTSSTYCSISLRQVRRRRFSAMSISASSRMEVPAIST